MISMHAIPSVLRRAEHEALSTVTLSGSVLDLGGEKGAEYLSHIKGEFTPVAVNLDRDAGPDILHDLEQPLSLASASYDHALLINVLEHVFEYRQLIREAARLVRPGGNVVIVVPFLFPLHPSPKDFFRFSPDTLERECEAAGLVLEECRALGSGVFAARYVMLDRLLPYPLRLVNAYTFRYLAGALDSLFGALARASGKKYQARDYALGYFVRARR